MQQAVIFVRVSKKEQDYQRQVEDLRAVAQSQAVQVVAEIAEKISGAKRNQEREGIQQLLALSRRGAIQKVLVSEVSRLGRSTVEVLQIVEELTQLGISIYVQNFGIETLKNGKRNPVAQFMFTLLAEFARLERETLRERILSGMDEARRQGVTIGRPVGATEEKAVFLKKYAAVARQLRAGQSVRNTAKLCDVAINTVRKVKAML
ncbi:DNA invertase Pin-like site-specific DNA recombinase [Hymenobacter luteus]|uniref:DNA invertase Pin-like site-specific DNA recombinase n=2 Tax=Hymenobacter TaxID=89966 RepID=A0A7W9T5Z4_9BACT|nr:MULTISPECIES: recombinase family protein [Hymenobacter]MBB4603666.1 DNA invertase Pin-like site-specific DNA recombinase [Hymenobacter latericoloratus]MBB6061413.1 DNA invertase Pin-like site-specific DNA recombinase [Hymenobacter luteus]